MAGLQGTAQTFSGGVSDNYTTPFPMSLGTKARDSFGNEFVLCQTGAATTVAPEMVVVIGSDFSVAPIGAVGATDPAYFDDIARPEQLARDLAGRRFV